MFRQLIRAKRFGGDLVRNGSWTRLYNGFEIWRGMRSGCLKPFKVDQRLIHCTFTLFHDPDRAGHVLKIPTGTTQHSARFIRAVRCNANHERYKRLLEGLCNLKHIGIHAPRVTAVRSDGGYSSPIVKGVNLASAQRDLVATGLSPLVAHGKKLKDAVASLEANLAAYIAEFDSLPGDWALHNLTLTDEGIIVNVDAEGYFSYDKAAIENDINFIRTSLANLLVVCDMAADGAEGRAALRSLHMVSYVAMRNATSYNGELFLPGYHSLQLGRYYLRGQRECRERLRSIPYDFNGKVVADFGCNVGGMLHALSDQVSHAFGLDYDPNCINAARAIARLNGFDHSDFYVVDLNDFDESVVRSMFRDFGIDICFLLSVCMWINNWQNLVRFCADIAESMLFETNGSNEQQSEQYAFLVEIFDVVEELATRSLDDPLQPDRRLYICRGSRRIAASLSSNSTNSQFKSATFASGADH